MNITKFDFEEYIRENFDFKPKGDGMAEVNIDCINEDCDDNWKRGKHMGVNFEMGVAHCLKCDAAYNVVKFLMVYEKISYNAAQARIRTATAPRTYGSERLLTAIDSLQSLGPAKAKIEEVKLVKPVSLPFHIPISPLSPAWEYLKGRRISEKTIEHFRLSYCPAGDYAGRIIIPVYVDGNLISFQGRTIHKSAEPKYLFPTDQDFAQHLYNWDDAKFFGTLILVEGVTDAWRTREASFHNVAGTFGKSLKDAQAKAIKANDRIKTVIFFWDGNAIAEAWNAAKELAPHKEVKVVELPYEQEPDTCPNISDIIAEAIPFRSLSPLQIKLRLAFGEA